MMRIISDMNKSRYRDKINPYAELGITEVRIEMDCFLSQTRELARKYYRRFAEEEALSEQMS